MSPKKWPFAIRNTAIRRVRPPWPRFFELRERYKRLLDLSEIPPAAREEEGVETFRLLWAVIARLDLPELDEIPDAATDEDGEPPTFWRIPGTEITIARVEEGSRAGEYLFSADTVERARSFHALVRELPYQRPVPLGDLSRMQQQLTGWMIPMAWVESFPDWANTLVLGQVLWKWFAVLLLFALAFAVVMGVYLRSRRRRRAVSLRAYLRQLSTPLVLLALAPLLDYFTAIQINTSDWNEFLAIQEDIDLRILKIVEEVGTGFAIPSRLYLARDGGIDAERQQAAAKQVREWVAAQSLPFPDFPDEYRKQIMDTLDYPPDGSPGADEG